ncbi:hypothetical protein ACIPZ5_14775, partial [Pseudomonas sp. NPDC089428]|uniref:hypothetical protein n=1 Tax=Pseudomonas sp. NPDC089428 TaxID=3364467 RepID=UPI0038228C25
MPAFSLLASIPQAPKGVWQAPGGLETVFSLSYFNFLKLKVDAHPNPLIMRPTSSDNGTTNSLRFNELDDSEGAER